MARDLRYATATIVTVGPFFDQTDGVAIEDAIAEGANEKITFICDGVANGAPTVVLDMVATNASTDNDVTDLGTSGYYGLELTAANTTYFGRAVLSITNAAAHCPVFHEFNIISQQDFDRKYAAVADSTGVTELLTRIPDATAGAAGGLLIAGSNAATTLASLTVTAATTLTGNVALADGLTIAAPSTGNRAGITVTGNGTGAGIISTGGATAAGISAVGVGAGGHGISAVSGTTAATAGIYAAGGATNATNGMLIKGGSTSGVGLSVTTTSGDGVSVNPTAGHALNLVANGTTKHGINAAGGATTSHGIVATGGGVGHGIVATSGGGATGDGIRGVAVSTAGHGVSGLGTTTGNGMNLVGGSGGAGLVATGVGAFAGIAATGGTGGAGIAALGVGAGAGITATGGATNGKGVSAVGTGSGDGLTVTGPLAVSGTTTLTGAVTATAGIVANAITGTLATVTSVTGIAANGITNASFHSDVGSTALATNTIAKAAEKAVGVAGASLTGTGIPAATVTALGTGSGLTAVALADTTSDAVLAHAVWGADATSYQAAGTFGLAIGDPTTDSAGGLYKGVVTDATGLNVAVDVVALKAETVEILTDTAVIGALGAGLTALATAAELAKVPKSDAAVSWNATALAAINAEVVDVLTVDTFAEPASVPAATSTLKDMLHWLFTLGRNTRTQSATAAALRNDADGADIGTSATSDSGTVFTASKWTT
jgi:hypothetical protein